jgi:hypothetical protein
MSISYSGLRTRSKATLPSVSSWGVNMAIEKDPPKSIHTRRKDKVGETAGLTQMNSDAGDRIAQNINMFAMGVDPMVDISFSNNGTNGGVRRGGIIQSASLPYRINEAFRPPVVRQEQLLPLSRLPRVWTTAFTQPSFPDFSKKMMEPNENDNTVGAKKNADILRTSVRPTAVFHSNNKIEKPNNVSQSINSNPIRVEGFSGTRNMDISTKFNQTPLHTIVNDPMKVAGFVNNGSNDLRRETAQEIGTGKFIQSSIHNDVKTNFQSHKMTPLTDIVGYTDKRINENNLNVFANTTKTGQSKITLDDNLGYADMRVNNNLQHIDIDSNKTGVNRHEYIHYDRELERNLPSHSAQTNIFYPIEVNMNGEQIQREAERNRPIAQGTTNSYMGMGVDNTSNRNASLKQTLSVGGYEDNIGDTNNKRVLVNDYGNVSLNSEKRTMNQKIFDLQMGRETNRNPPFM